MKDIKIVIGANFGDEGKGKLTDYYTKNLVVEEEELIGK